MPLDNLPTAADASRGMSASSDELGPSATKAAGVATVAWAEAGSNRVTRHFRPDWRGAQELVDRREVDALLADYEQVLADKRRLTRDLDVLLNGEEGAARQASLCDIVAQVRSLVTPDAEMNSPCNGTAAAAAVRPGLPPQCLGPNVKFSGTPDVCTDQPPAAPGVSAATQG